MAAAEALIVLSLLGCDDAGVSCDILQTVDKRFETVEACSAASDGYLAATQDADYPAIVAVCTPLPEMASAPVLPPEGPAGAAIDPQMPAPPAVAPPMSPTEVVAAPLDTPVGPPQEVKAEEKGFLARVAAAVAGLAPGRETVTKPLEVAADGAARAGSAVIVGVKRVAEAVNPF